MLDAKAQYKTDLFRNYTHNSKRIQRYINSLSKSPQIPYHAHLSPCSADSPLAQANLFNKYFHSVYNQSSVHDSPSPSQDTLDTITIHETDVWSLWTPPQSHGCWPYQTCTVKILHHLPLSSSILPLSKMHSTRLPSLWMETSHYTRGWWPCWCLKLLAYFSTMFVLPRSWKNWYLTKSMNSSCLNSLITNSDCYKINHVHNSFYSLYILFTPITPIIYPLTLFS